MAINLNGHPWDKIMHVVIGQGISLVVMGVLHLLGIATGAALLIGIAASLGIWYGREQFGYWKAHKGAYPAGDIGFILKSWLIWNWSRDGVLDFVAPAVAHAVQLALYRAFFGPLW